MRLQNLFGLGRRVTDVLADKIITRHGNEVTLAHVAEAMEKARHLHRHRRLAGARVASEAHVKRWRFVREPHRLARPLDDQQGSDLANAPLDGLEANQFAVEFL